MRAARHGGPSPNATEPLAVLLGVFKCPAGEVWRPAWGVPSPAAAPPAGGGRRVRVAAGAAEDGGSKGTQHTITEADIEEATTFAAEEAPIAQEASNVLDLLIIAVIVMGNA